MATESRRGSILIIVIGISMILLSLMVMFLQRMRSDAEQMAAVVQDAQARVMLHAALMYLQESSRIGWSDRARETGGAAASGHDGFRRDGYDPEDHTRVSGSVSDRGGEAFGWTDVRNGWLGPLGAIDPATKAVPVPAWWDDSSGASYRPLPEDDELPPPDRRRWPMPGATIVANIALPELPPYAVRPTWAANPVIHRNHIGDASFDADLWHSGNIKSDLKNRTVGHEGYHGMLDPQPVQDEWADDGNATDPDREDFQTGRLRDPMDPTSGIALVPGSDGMAWFRIYRETLRDHNGVDDPGYDDPYYDAVDGGAGVGPAIAICRDGASPANGHQVKNWNVFVITCGAGPTRGYRDFAEAQAADPGLFPDQHAFDQLRQRESILWFRVEWTGQVGGGFENKGWYHRRHLGSDTAAWQQLGNPTVHRFNAQFAAGGGFKWIQQLHREPERW